MRMRRNVEDWDVLSLEEKCYEAVWNSKSLTLYEKFHPWNLTDHGCKELQNDDELNAYMVAYGEMHIVKCRAALQNFPFEELERQGVYFEIIDWGCGQGLATLTLLQMLFERQKISRLRRITLVELSKAASKRAGDWVKVWLKNYNNVVVKTVNKPIPNDVNDRMDEVDCKEYVCINLFSNILDIRQLSLKWLADKTSSLAAENYMVCVGPNLQKNTRIQDFCGYFSPKKYFTNFAVKNLGLTSRTHYKFGCEAKGFMHRNGWRKNGNYQEKAGDFLKIDDYDFALREVANDYGEAVANFYEQFRAAAEELSLCENSIFDVYYRPSFQGDEVDFVLATKTKGFVLINVLRENGCKMYNSEECNAYERIKRIKDNFYDYHCKDLGLDCIGRRTLYGNIKIGLLFVDCDKDEALQKAKNVDKHLKAFSAKMVKQDIIEFIHRLPNQDGKYYDDIVSIIAPDWHSYRDGNDKVKPSPHQTKVIKNSAKRLAVKGVAGCGKTMVLPKIRQLLILVSLQSRDYRGRVPSRGNHGIAASED